MSCDRCKLPYPAELLAPIFLAEPDGSEYTAPVCGICALERINEAHGSNRESFPGEYAEGLRQDAIEWRRKHPTAMTVRAAADRRETRR